MEIANVWLQLDKFGSTVPKIGITPAEAVYLTAEFEKSANGKPVRDIQLAGTVTRNARDEVLRLKQQYSEKRINDLFPGATPNVPQTFVEVAEQIGYEPPAPVKPTPAPTGKA
jgi:hypothetical protein